MRSNKISGFTFIEILITMGIITAVSIFGYVAFSGLKPIKNLEATTNEASAVLRAVQKKSVTQESGRAWGIRFFGSTSTVPSYAVATGTSYSAGSVDRTYYLGRGMKFGNPGGSSTLDIFFSAITGKLAQNQIISLNTGGADGFVNDIITNKQGSVTVRERTGVVGYWHLDEATSTAAYDASGFDNTGAIHSGASACSNPPTADCPAWQSGTSCKSGGCLSLDGSNDFVRATSSASLNMTGSAMTVSAWINRDSVVSWQRIVGKYYYTGTDSGSWLMYFNSSSTNTILCRFNTGSSWGSATTPTAVSLGEWTYAACVYDGSRLYAYLNNASSSVSKSGIIASSDYPVTIGTTSDGSTTQNHFDGEIDEVRIYNRALSAQEILDEYNDLKQ